MNPHRFSNSKALLTHFSASVKAENRFITLFGLIQIGMTISFAFLVATLLNTLLNEKTAELPDPLFWILIIGALIGRALAEYMQTVIGQRASLKIRKKLRSHCLQRYRELNIQLLPNLSTGEMTNLLTSEIDSLHGYFSDYAAQKRLAILMPIAVMMASAGVSWLVPAILALTAPLVPIFMMLVGHKAADASRNNLKQLNRLSDLLTDRLKNMTCLQIAGTTSIECEKIHQQSETFRESTMRVLRLAFLSGTLLEFFSAISVALVAVYLGLHFLDKYQLGMWADTITLFDGVFLLMLAPEFYLPLRKLGALYHAKADAESVADHVIILEQLARNSNPAVSESPQQSPQQPDSLPEMRSLTIRSVQAGSLEHPVHEPISFKLAQGERLLIRGSSGSGKTSLLDTLAGLRPLNHGEVHVNGNPFDLYQQSEWHDQIGYMAQQPELLHTSIRNNLSLGREFSDVELYSALKQAQAEAFVRALPEGLDYRVTDAGGFISGGQAQRIALARVFLHRPKLLLLDEPTASLDHETATGFLASLDRYCQSGGMIIMASHRPYDQALFSGEITVSAVRKEKTL